MNREKMKKYLAVLLLIAMACVGLSIPAAKGIRRIRLAEGPEAREEDIAEALPLRELVLAPGRLWDRLTDRRYFPEHKIWRSPEGVLLQGSEPGQTAFALERTVELARYCEATSRDFAYVILPGKPASDAELTEQGIPCGRNAAADDMKQGLAAVGIPCLDEREAFAGPDFYDSFFKTDHHWTPEAGLQAAGDLLHFLNRRFGESYDVSLLDPEGFTGEMVRSSWVGEQGQAALGPFGETDEFRILKPKAPVNLRYRNEDKNLDLTGGFGILLDPDRLAAENKSPYYSYLHNNSRMEFWNPEAPAGDLLVIKDSFSNVLLPYLSLAAHHITAWDMRTDAGIYPYLEAHPEIRTVLIAYNIAFVPTERMYAFEGREEVREPALLQMEYLDRGLAAVQTDDGVFLSWRLLGTEAYDTVFSVYRNGEKIAEVPDVTCYTDPEGTAADHYAVLPEPEEATDAQAVSVLPEACLRIPLEVPAGSVGADGEACTYSANDAACGDLDGDGSYELVLKWDPSNAFDSGARAKHSGPVYIDAYRLDGTRLWRIDLGPNINAGAHFTQMAVYDLDLDGKAELVLKTAPGTKDGQGRYVTEASLNEAIRSADNGADLRKTVDGADTGGRVLSGDEYLTVFDGETGAAKDTIYYPHPRGTVSEWGDDWGNRSERFLTGIAYLDGVHPHVLAWRGYYGKTTVTAFRLTDGRLLQTADFDSSRDGCAEYAGQGNHSLSAGDVDGDGRDEVLSGSLALDDDLTPLWCSGRGHGDAQHLADYDPVHPGMEFFSVHEGAPYGMTLYDAASGEELFHADSSFDTGRGMMAHTGDTGGYFEMWGRGMDLYASHGGSRVERTDLPLTLNNFRLFWDGDLYDELLDGEFPEEDADRRIRITGNDGLDLLLPEGVTNNRSKHNVCLTADLFGDWREEIVARSADSRELLVYMSTIPTEHRLYTLMHDRSYRVQAAAQNSGYNQPPHLGYYLSETPDDRDQRRSACRIRTVHEGRTEVRK